MDDTEIQEIPASFDENIDLTDDAVEKSQEMLDAIDQLLSQYEILAGSPKDVLFTYIVIILACIVIFPLALMIVNSIVKGLSRWR
ncbi:MAG TPA: hypothetical protein GX497_03390 [Bacillus bacterium]|nr:hypothetical protein [Bacillus sp. (in: firmicutes)]